MKLSIWSSYYMELKIEEAVQRLIDNGIYCAELSDEHGLELLERDDDILATARKFKAFLGEKNFEMSQGHLWLKIALCTNEDAVEKLFRWIDLYEAVGVKNMVLHCDVMRKSDLPQQERLDKNVEKLRVLAEYVRDKDITICLENLSITTQSADDLLYIIDRVGSERIGICLDTGHLNITLKNQREFILKAGHRLKALHIADNEGQTDQHMMPFARGNIDFVEVVKSLKEIGYNGLFNLEIPGERKIPLELRDAKIGYIKTCFDYLMNV